MATQKKYLNETGRFFWAPQINVLTNGYENIHNLCDRIWVARMQGQKYICYKEGQISVILFNSLHAG